MVTNTRKVVGRGKMWLETAKVMARELYRFLGMVGYSQEF